MATRESRLALLQCESEHLKHYLHTLPAEAWRRPSVCAGWEVRDVVGHLIVNAEFLAGSLARGLQGDTAPPPGFPQADRANNAATMSSFIDQLSVARRTSLGTQLLATFNTTNDHLNQLFVGLGPTDWETLCYHLPGLLPARALLDLRITEVAIHGWDMRAGLEPEAHLSTPSLALLTEGGRGVIRWVFRRGAMVSEPVRYRFSITGAVPGTQDIVVTGDTARMETAGDMPAQAIFQCDTEAFVLLVYGRLKLGQALSTGRCDGQSTPALVAAFDRWFQGV